MERRLISKYFQALRGETRRAAWEGETAVIADSVRRLRALRAAFGKFLAFCRARLQLRAILLYQEDNVLRACLHQWLHFAGRRSRASRQESIVDEEVSIFLSLRCLRLKRSVVKRLRVRFLLLAAQRSEALLFQLRMAAGRLGRAIDESRRRCERLRHGCMDADFCRRMRCRWGASAFLAALLQAGERRSAGDQKVRLLRKMAYLRRMRTRASRRVALRYRHSKVQLRNMECVLRLLMARFKQHYELERAARLLRTSKGDAARVSCDRRLQRSHLLQWALLTRRRKQLSRVVRQSCLRQWTRSLLLERSARRLQTAALGFLARRAGGIYSYLQWYRAQLPRVWALRAVHRRRRVFQLLVRHTLLVHVGGSVEASDRRLRWALAALARSRRWYFSPKSQQSSELLHATIYRVRLLHRTLAWLHRCGRYGFRGRARWLRGKRARAALAALGTRSALCSRARGVEQRMARRRAHHAMQALNVYAFSRLYPRVRTRLAGRQGELHRAERMGLLLLDKLCRCVMRRRLRARRAPLLYVVHLRRLTAAAAEATLQRRSCSRARIHELDVRLRSGFGNLGRALQWRQQGLLEEGGRAWRLRRLGGHLSVLRACTLSSRRRRVEQRRRFGAHSALAGLSTQQRVVCSEQARVGSHILKRRLFCRLAFVSSAVGSHKRKQHYAQLLFKLKTLEALRCSLTALRKSRDACCAASEDGAAAMRRHKALRCLHRLSALRSERRTLALQREFKQLLLRRLLAQPRACLHTWRLFRRRRSKLRRAQLLARQRSCALVLSALRASYLRREERIAEHQRVQIYCSHYKVIGCLHLWVRLLRARQNMTLRARRLWLRPAFDGWFAAFAAATRRGLLLLRARHASKLRLLRRVYASWWLYARTCGSLKTCHSIVARRGVFWLKKLVFDSMVAAADRRLLREREEVKRQLLSAAAAAHAGSRLRRWLHALLQQQARARARAREGLLVVRGREAHSLHSAILSWSASALVRVRRRKRSGDAQWRYSALLLLWALERFGVFRGRKHGSLLRRVCAVPGRMLVQQGRVRRMLRFWQRVLVPHCRRLRLRRCLRTLLAQWRAIAVSHKFCRQAFASRLRLAVGRIDKRHVLHTLALNLEHKHRLRALLREWRAYKSRVKFSREAFLPRMRSLLEQSSKQICFAHIKDCVESTKMLAALRRFVSLNAAQRHLKAWSRAYLARRLRQHTFAVMSKHGARHLVSISFRKWRLLAAGIADSLRGLAARNEAWRRWRWIAVRSAVASKHCRQRIYREVLSRLRTASLVMARHRRRLALGRTIGRLVISAARKRFAIRAAAAFARWRLVAASPRPEPVAAPSSDWKRRYSDQLSRARGVASAPLQLGGHNLASFAERLGAISSTASTPLSKTPVHV